MSVAARRLMGKTRPWEPNPDLVLSSASCWLCRYFNSELSEEAKKLIGDIAPKKIEVKVRRTDGRHDGCTCLAAMAGNRPDGVWGVYAQWMQQEEEGADKKGAGSAWNYAGTFEVRLV